MKTLKIYKRVIIRNKSQKKSPNRCKLIRTWLYSTLSERFNSDAGWLQNHISNCPRCRKRFVFSGKVNLALSFMKAEPHDLGLLKRANVQAVGVLKHSLREAPKASKIKQMQPEPKLLERLSRHVQPVGNMAACAAILLLMKTGIFSSMDGFQAKGQKAIRQYYASRVGEDLAEELFPTDSRQRNSRGSGRTTAT